MRKRSHMQTSEPILEHLLSLIRYNKAKGFIRNNSIVGDIGCGYRGGLVCKMSQKINKGFGYDISVQKNNLPKNIYLKEVDINSKIDNKVNYFDYVSILAVLEHVNSPNFILRQIKNMLKKGGSVIITTPHKNGKYILEFLSWLNLVSKDEIDDHKNYFNVRSLRKLVEKEGFRIKKIGLFGLFYMNIYCVAAKIN